MAIWLLLWKFETSGKRVKAVSNHLIAIGRIFKSHAKNGSMLILWNFDILNMATLLLFLILLIFNKSRIPFFIRTVWPSVWTDKRVWFDKYVALILDVLHKTCRKALNPLLVMSGFRSRQRTRSFLLFCNALARILTHSLLKLLWARLTSIRFDPGSFNNLAISVQPFMPILFPLNLKANRL